MAYCHLSLLGGGGFGAGLSAGGPQQINSTLANTLSQRVLLAGGAFGGND